MSLEAVTHAVNVRRDGEILVTLDQTLLPNVTKYLNLTTAEEMWEAIYSLRVRGAPAIGIFAGVMEGFSAGVQVAAVSLLAAVPAMSV